MDSPPSSVSAVSFPASGKNLQVQMEEMSSILGDSASWSLRSEQSTEITNIITRQQQMILSTFIFFLLLNIPGQKISARQFRVTEAVRKC